MFLFKIACVIKTRGLLFIITLKSKCSENKNVRGIYYNYNNTVDYFFRSKTNFHSEQLNLLSLTI